MNKRHAKLFRYTALLEFLIGIPRFIIYTGGLTLLFYPFILSGNVEMAWEELLMVTSLVGFVIAYLNLIRFLLGVREPANNYMSFALGARGLSVREREKLHAVRKEVLTRANDKTLLGFEEVLIIEGVYPKMMGVGTTLYITPATLKLDTLAALYAHELGHLNNDDTSLISWLRDLLPRPARNLVGSQERSMQMVPYNSRTYDEMLPQFTTQGQGFIIQQSSLSSAFSNPTNTMTYFRSGLSLNILAWEWAKHFRSCDYRADKFSSDLGYRDDLIDHLERFTMIDTSVPLQLAWRPSNELRIDALQHPHLYQDSLEQYKVRTNTITNENPSIRESLVKGKEVLDKGLETTIKAGEGIYSFIYEQWQELRPTKQNSSINASIVPSQKDHLGSLTELPVDSQPLDEPQTTATTLEQRPPTTEKISIVDLIPVLEEATTAIAASSELSLIYSLFTKANEAIGLIDKKSVTNKQQVRSLVQARDNLNQQYDKTKQSFLDKKTDPFIKIANTLASNKELSLTTEQVAKVKQSMLGIYQLKDILGSEFNDKQQEAVDALGEMVIEQPAPNQE